MQQDMPRLVIATRNAHKTREIREIVGERYEVLDVNDFEGLPEVEESGDSFLANATLKAVAISRELPGLVLADDSGLEVDALGGEPGVYSSSYGGVEGDHARNNERLLREMAGREARSARFRCVMVFAEAGEVRDSFEGTVEGRILDQPSGEGGFGYDPLFAPQGFEQSFAELGAELKNEMSHRGRALAHALEWLREQSGEAR